MGLTSGACRQENPRQSPPILPLSHNVGDFVRLNYFYFDFGVPNVTTDPHNASSDLTRRLYIPHAIRAGVYGEQEAQLNTFFLKQRCATARRILQDATRLRGGRTFPDSHFNLVTISQSRARSQDPINQFAVASYSSAFQSGTEWRKVLCALPLWTRVGDSSGLGPSPESEPNIAGVAHAGASHDEGVLATWLNWDDVHGGDSSPLFGERNQIPQS
ncbi:hypothetical protein V8E53_012653 [Lactarius tabidus]